VEEDGSADGRVDRQEMAVPQGAFRLVRPDATGRAPLRAWDAADEMALRHLDEVGLVEDDGNDAPTVVVVGDGWGALAAPLASLHPTVVVDSYTAARAIVANLGANGVDPGSVTIADPLGPLPEAIDVGVVKVPKASAVLDHHLARLAPRLAPSATVIGAGMTRHVHSSTVDAFGRWIGPTATTRAVRKARLLLATAGPDRATGPDGATAPEGATGAGRGSRWPRETTLDGPGGPIVAIAHAGVFAAGRLDRGTAALLAALPEPGTHRRAVDLGCGTGVVGTVLARRDPAVEVTFVDDSALALASARATWERNLGDRPARFVHGDGLLDPEPIDCDLVCVNPPFHRDHAVGDATAWRMFVEARERLAPGGELLVVGNRHLAHHAKLARLFGRRRVEVVGSDPAYVVCQATVAT